jgi:hypothetical protein
MYCHDPHQSNHIQTIKPLRPQQQHRTAAQCWRPGSSVAASHHCINVGMSTWHFDDAQAPAKGCMHARTLNHCHNIHSSNQAPLPASPDLTWSAKDGPTPELAFATASSACKACSSQSSALRRHRTHTLRSQQQLTATSIQAGHRRMHCTCPTMACNM